MSSSRMGYAAWGFVVLLWGAVQIADGAGLRINHTPSLASSLWRLTPLHGPLERGQIVGFCPPDTNAIREARTRRYLGSGRCPAGTEPLLKHVIALEGDRVSLHAEGVVVNGVPLASTRPLEKDGCGRPIARIAPGTWRIGLDEFWAGSSAHPHSFDSRYFGPVPVSQVIGIAHPLY